MHAQSKSIPRFGILLAALFVALLAARAMPVYAVAATITNVSPNQGPIAGGTDIVITGTGFGTAGDPEVTAVTVGGTAATSFAVVNDTTLNVTTPAHAAGTVDIVVTTDEASANTAADNFTYVGLPTVTSLSVSGGPATGGTTVTITGTNFIGMDPSGDVTFGGTPAAYIVQSPTSILATAPPHAVGTVQVQVTTPFGVSADTAADDFTYGAVAPTVTGLAPSSGPIAGGNLVVITGTGFTGVTGAAGVKFGAVNATSYTFVGDTTINAVAPAQAAGTVNVTVTHPTGGTSANTTADDYTYAAGPSITSVSPSIGHISGGTVVTITGTGFTGATAVSFGGTAATTFVVTNSTTITATAPAHTAGDVDIVVTGPSGSSANTTADNFTYTAGPIVTGVAPISGPTAGGTSVVITGQGFTGVTGVSFGGTPATSFVFNNATQITAVSPAKTAGTISILVTTPLGTSADTPADNFLYGSGPTITSINPSSGPTAGGTTVTITGTGFTGATSVTFGATAATSFNVVNDTTITAVSPVGVNGVVRITVVTPIGTTADTAADNFTYGTGATTTFTLYFRWTLIVWSGIDGADIATTLAGQETPDNPLTNNVSGIVTAIFRYNNPLQKFEGFFPGSAGIPGANDFTTFDAGEVYWIAINQSGQTSWTVRTN